MHWNKGHGFFKNKIHDIYYVLEKYKPHMMSISEANYDNVEKMKIKDYSVEHNDLGKGHKISRQILLVHNTIEYTRKCELETKYIAAIVINVKLATKSNMSIISY